MAVPAFTLSITLTALPVHSSSGWGESWLSVSFLTVEVMEVGRGAGALLAKPLPPEEVRLHRPVLSMGTDYTLISEPCSTRRVLFQFLW